ncbi:hypothetical protein S245_000251 [Arachis hypogaea]
MIIKAHPLLCLNLLRFLIISIIMLLIVNYCYYYYYYYYSRFFCFLVWIVVLEGGVVVWCDSCDMTLVTVPSFFVLLFPVFAPLDSAESVFCEAEEQLKLSALLESEENLALPSFDCPCSYLYPCCMLLNLSVFQFHHKQVSILGGASAS